MDIEHKNSNFGKVTISIGVVYGQILSNQRVEDIVQLADEMLYKAKRKGKNRCEVLEKK
jgi:diguanylate cyclase (GGDEF)-like protein